MFDREVIAEIIAGFYAEEKAPLAKEVYKKFLDYKRAQPGFQMFNISEKTFRTVLRALGYWYKVINKRIALTERPSIIAWRGRFLKTMMDNKAKGEEALSIIYLDETWFDSNLRAIKGKM